MHIYGFTIVDTFAIRWVVMIKVFLRFFFFLSYLFDGIVDIYCQRKVGNSIRSTKIHHVVKIIKKLAINRDISEYLKRDLLPFSPDIFVDFPD